MVDIDGELGILFGFLVIPDSVIAAVAARVTAADMENMVRERQMMAADAEMLQRQQASDQSAELHPSAMLSAQIDPIARLYGSGAGYMGLDVNTLLRQMGVNVPQGGGMMGQQQQLVPDTDAAFTQAMTQQGQAPQAQQEVPGWQRSLAPPIFPFARELMQWGMQKGAPAAPTPQVAPQQQLRLSGIS